jgi:small-conductance mechanosensitive channel
MPFPWESTIRISAVILVAIATGVVIRRILLTWARRRSAAGEGDRATIILEHLSPPAVWGAPLLAAWFVLPIIGAGIPTDGGLGHAFAVVLIILFAWLVIGAIRAGEELIRERFPVDVRDNLQARKVHTQTEVVRKILVVIVAVIALSGILMTFEPLREIGTGILASAGLAGLIIGLAAQRTLGNLLAGIQIALTQPIRLDDVVVVEGEWGRIEEITLTYVVVRIWDLRRLVLPISWFIENPFQNWTRTSADILGTVIFFADYTIPVDKVREELEAIVKDNPLWDGKVCGLSVVGATERSLELRCLMSAKDSGSAWDLRCEVREKLLAWIQKEYPEALPRLRAEVDQGSPGEESSPSGSEPER